MQIAITLNGEPRSIADGTHVADLVASLELKKGRVAVERNREIVPMSQWGEVALADGDALEIVHFVGGGQDDSWPTGGNPGDTWTVAGRTFTAVARTNTSVLMISQASSEQSICFVIPRSSVHGVVDELRREFKAEISSDEINDVMTFNEASIITAVGMGISETPGVSGRVFSALGTHGINVYAIAQGSSECAISMIVSADKCDDAVRSVHQLTVA